jgi:hypothetical protein
VESGTPLDLPANTGPHPFRMLSEHRSCITVFSLLRLSLLDLVKQFPYSGNRNKVDKIDYPT